MIITLVSCSPSSTGPTSGDQGIGDTTHRTLKINPNASSVTVGTNVTFTLSATPSALPKPYTITWHVDTVQFVRNSVATLSVTFQAVGKHVVSAILTDSSHSTFDSATTSITVNDTTSTPPITTGLGGFRFVINRDTLDRAQFQHSCSATVRYASYAPTINVLTINLNFARTQLGVGGFTISVGGMVPGPVPGTYPIVSFDKSGGFNGSLDSASVQYSSLDGGTLTVTKFDTMDNLVSGTFRMVVAKRLPTVDPNMLDTVVASFSDAAISDKQFGQGNMTADGNGTPFQPIDNEGLNLKAYISPGTQILKIEGVEVVNSVSRSLAITINTPQIGTFTIGDVSTPGTAGCFYSSGNQYYNTMNRPNSGTLTITRFDPIHRRISGTFTASPGIYATRTTVPITNGIIDNVTWAQY